MKSKNHALIKILLCSLPWLCASAAQAELADRNKPMHIEADSMRYDDINKITNATGRVIGTKGTMVLIAMTIWQLPVTAQDTSTATLICMT